MYCDGGGCGGCGSIGNKYFGPGLAVIQRAGMCFVVGRRFGGYNMKKLKAKLVLRVDTRQHMSIY